MSWFKSTRRQKRYELLRADGLLSYEALVLSKLPTSTPALQALRRASRSFLTRFDRESQHKGWSQWKARTEYRIRVRKQYTHNGWLVQQDPVGKQRGPQAGRPNPWAKYRWYEKDNPPPEEYRRLLKTKKKYNQKLRNRRLRRVGGEAVVNLTQILNLRTRKQK